MILPPENLDSSAGSGPSPASSAPPPTRFAEGCGEGSRSGGQNLDLSGGKRVRLYVSRGEGKFSTDCSFSDAFRPVMASIRLTWLRRKISITSEGESNSVGRSWRPPGGPGQNVPPPGVFAAPSGRQQDSNHSTGPAACPGQRQESRPKPDRWLDFRLLWCQKSNHRSGRASGQMFGQDPVPDRSGG